MTLAIGILTVVVALGNLALALALNGITTEIRALRMMMENRP